MADQDAPRDTSPPRDRAPSHTGAANEPGWLSALLAIDRAIGRAEQVVVAALLAILIGVAVYQAILRNLFHESPAWTFEAIRYAVFFIALSGAALSAHTQQILRMDVLTRALSPRGRAIARIVTALFTVAMCAAFGYGGLRLRAAVATETDYEILSAADGALALPIAAALIAVHQIIRAVQIAAGLARGEVIEDDQAVH